MSATRAVLMAKTAVKGLRTVKKIEVKVFSKQIVISEGLEIREVGRL